jgi:hypothetical protein
MPEMHNCAEGPAVSCDCPAIRKEQLDHIALCRASRVDSPEIPLCVDIVAVVELLLGSMMNIDVK